MRKLFASVAALILSGCATGADSSKQLADDPVRRAAELAAARRPEPVTPATIVPDAFSRTLPTEIAVDARLVPESMLATADVVRPKAEVREGPGIDFALQDTMLTQGQRVLTFMRVGVWQKVLIPGTWRKGWVHTQALSEPRPNVASMEVDFNTLPTVLAVRPIETARAFPGNQELKVAIPKGSMFRSLMVNEWGTLVWLPETNSVMWMARKDVQ